MNKSDRIPFFLAALITAAAFVMRYKCAWSGFPLMVHPDENVIVNAALKIVQTGDLNPHVFYYPSLNIYLQAVVFYLIAFVEKSIAAIPVHGVPEITFYLYGRIFNVFLSSATVLVTYEIGRRLVNAWAGLAAACFVCASYLHMTNSFVITVDSSVAFWASLSVLTSAMIYTRVPKRSYYLAGAIFAGFAIGSKYTAFPIVLPLVVAHLYHARRTGNYLNKDIVMALLAVPIAFVLSTPYAVLDHKTFFNAIVYQRNEYLGHLGAEAVTNTSYILYLKSMFLEGYGIPSMVLALTGFFLLLSRERWKALLLASFPLGLFLFVGAYKTFFARNLVAVVPFLAVFSGLGVFSIVEWLRQKLFLQASWLRKAAVFAVGLLLVMTSISGQIERDQELLRTTNLPDTRWVGLKWIEEHLPAGSHILRERYTPPLEKYSGKFHVSYAGMFPVARGLGNATEIPSIDYVVVSSGDYARFVDHPDIYPAQAQAYNDFFARNDLVKEFHSDNNTMSGPTIRVYRIGR